jgi:hypothetical protein
MARLRNALPTTGWQTEEVLVLVLAGQRERAIQTLLRVAQPGGRTLWWLAAPELDPIARDARVRRLYEQSRRLTSSAEGPRPWGRMNAGGHTRSWFVSVSGLVPTPALSSNARVGGQKLSR